MPDDADELATPVASRAIPRVVWAATAAFAVLLAGWSVLAPLGEAPDEPAHLALVLHLADGNGYPAYDGLENQAAIIRLCRTWAAATRACPRPGELVTPTSVRLHPRSEAPDRAARPAWDDEGGDTPVGQLNQMPQHPPLYYQAMAQVLRLERALGGGPWSTDRELALLRLANALLVAPLPLLAWWAASRFGADRTTAVTAAVAVLAVPMLSHIGSTLNNDNLLTLLGAVLAALLAGVARGDRSRATAGAVGVVAGLALLTKAFAVVFPPAIALAYLAGAVEPDRPAWSARLRRMALPVAIAAGATVAMAGWWYVGVRSRTGSFTPSIESRRYTSALAPDGFTPDLGAFASEFGRNLPVRYWGSFGWYTVPIPFPMALVLTGVALAAVAVAFWPQRGPEGSDRLQRGSLAVPFLLLGGFVMARAWDLYATTSRFQFMQGRYLFAGIVGMAVLVALGIRRIVGWASPVVVAVAALILQLDAVRRSLETWWGGPGVDRFGQVRALVAWGAWPGELVAVLVVAVVASGLWLAVELIWEARSSLPRGAEPGPVGSTPP